MVTVVSVYISLCLIMRGHEECRLLFTTISSIYADFFWLDDYEKVQLCFRTGKLCCSTFCFTEFWERRQLVIVR